MNAIFSKPLREFLSSEGEVDDAALISVDSKGIDIRVRQGAQVKYMKNCLPSPSRLFLSRKKLSFLHSPHPSVQFNIQRLAFDVPHKVETLEEAKRALHKIIKTSSK